ncbi:hypothetical protein HTT03_09455 [Sulfitobacter sp. S0837]|uniref:hypothetical protein n=1 Tax=Sulfitobacter maritimus TaxID=2741719 RepID=UPI001581E1E2|nr:hypothetical protein [Sulfitobacter maritimus]NUH65511.1 hypothetical protein [Sulfitobacter maritimus]
MIRTILISDYIQVQGTFVRNLEDGSVVVSTGSGQFAGRPIQGEVKASSQEMLAIA